MSLLRCVFLSALLIIETSNVWASQVDAISTDAFEIKMGKEWKIEKGSEKSRKDYSLLTGLIFHTTKYPKAVFENSPEPGIFMIMVNAKTFTNTKNNDLLATDFKFDSIDGVLERLKAERGARKISDKTIRKISDHVTQERVDVESDMPLACTYVSFYSSAYVELEFTGLSSGRCSEHAQDYEELLNHIVWK